MLEEESVDINIELCCSNRKEDFGMLIFSQVTFANVELDKGE